jgi:hypothetical protein
LLFEDQHEQNNTHTNQRDAKQGEENAPAAHTQDADN